MKKIQTYFTKALFLIFSLLFIITLVQASCLFTQHNETVENNHRADTDGRALCYNDQLYQCGIWGCPVHTWCNGLYTSDKGDVVGAWTCRAIPATNPYPNIWCRCAGNGCNPTGNGTRCDDCLYSIPGTQEVCNNADDDCDGAVDDGLTQICYSARADTKDVGTCHAGTKSCNAGIWDTTCIGEVVPRTEVCDGNDDDCDGVIDNGFDCIKNSVGCTASCMRATQLQACSGSVPQNAQTNYGDTNGKFVQTYTNGNWLPLTKSYEFSNNAGECKWKCNTNYSFYNGACYADARQATCLNLAAMPENAIMNDMGQNGKYNQLFNNGSWTPSGITAAYSETPGNCKWMCDVNYHYDSNTLTCILNTKTSLCAFAQNRTTLPENAKWKDNELNGYFTQKWVNGIWTPSDKNAAYSEITGECNYACKQFTKSCLLNQETYCGAGIQECDQGYWSACSPENATICTKNQYCDRNASECKFCESGKKNCDLNLSNGCEKSVLSDKNNCGACGVQCSGTCTNGICSGTSIIVDTNKCTGITCNANSYCAEATGSCLCKAGYSDCDGITQNGCEKMGTCATPQPECTKDLDCDAREKCVAQECVQDPNGCIINADCESDEKCENDTCVKLNCATGFSIKNRACICEGAMCNSICKTGKGICCVDTWNEGLESCQFTISEKKENAIRATNNEEAIGFVEQAKTSAEEGNINKAKTEIMLAELKTAIAQTGNADLEIQYEEALLALDEKNYAGAQAIVTEALGEIDITQGTPLPIIPIAIIVIVLIVVALVAVRIIKKRKYSE